MVYSKPREAKRLPYGVAEALDFHRNACLRRRGRLFVKSNMVYRMCNNMVYTLALQVFVMEKKHISAVGDGSPVPCCFAGNDERPLQI